MNYRKLYHPADLIEERMDMARYRCRIYHMYSIPANSIYDDLNEFRVMVAGSNICLAFIKPLYDGNLECLVYLFADTVHRDKFLEEEKEYAKLIKLTKERKIV
jgi:hypothetical protein